MMMQLNLKGPLNLTPEHRRSLFLGDLSCFCQEADIFRYFQQFGDIEEIRIKRNTNGAGLGYGFITFQTSEAAEAALNLDGVVILGRPIKLSWASPRGPGAFPVDQKLKQRPNPKDNAASNGAQLHFSFISKQHHFLVTEATVREVFSHFGQVIDVTIKKTGNQARSGEQTGYGFLNYPLTDEGIESAIKASKIVRQVHINNVLFDCCLTWGLEQIIAQRQQQQDFTSYGQAYLQPSPSMSHSDSFTSTNSFSSTPRGAFESTPSSQLLSTDRSYLDTKNIPIHYANSYSLPTPPMNTTMPVSSSPPEHFYFSDRNSSVSSNSSFAPNPPRMQQMNPNLATFVPSGSQPSLQQQFMSKNSNSFYSSSTSSSTNTSTNFNNLNFFPQSTSSTYPPSF